MTKIQQFELHLSAPAHSISALHRRLVTISGRTTELGQRKATSRAMETLHQLYPSLLQTKLRQFPPHTTIMSRQLMIIEYEIGRLVMQEKLTLEPVAKTKRPKLTTLEFEYHMVDREKLAKRSTKNAPITQEEAPKIPELCPIFQRATDVSMIKAIVNAKNLRFDRNIMAVLQCSRPPDVTNVIVKSVQGDLKYPCAVIRCVGKRQESTWGSAIERVDVAFDVYVSLRRPGDANWTK